MPQQLVEFIFARGKHILSQKFAFYKMYPMSTSDMPLVICTCDLQVGLSKNTSRTLENVLLNLIQVTSRTLVTWTCNDVY